MRPESRTSASASLCFLLIAAASPAGAAGFALFDGVAYDLDLARNGNGVAFVTSTGEVRVGYTDGASYDYSWLGIGATAQSVAISGDGNVVAAGVERFNTTNSQLERSWILDDGTGSPLVDSGWSHLREVIVNGLDRTGSVGVEINSALDTLSGIYLGPGVAQLPMLTAPPNTDGAAFWGGLNAIANDGSSVVGTYTSSTDSFAPSPERDPWSPSAW